MGEVVGEAQHVTNVGCDDDKRNKPHSCNCHQSILNRKCSDVLKNQHQFLSLAWTSEKRPLRKAVSWPIYLPWTLQIIFSTQFSAARLNGRHFSVIGKKYSHKWNVEWWSINARGPFSPVPSITIFSFQFSTSIKDDKGYRNHFGEKYNFG